MSGRRSQTSKSSKENKAAVDQNVNIAQQLQEINTKLAKLDALEKLNKDLLTKLLQLSQRVDAVTVENRKLKQEVPSVGHSTHMGGASLGAPRRTSYARHSKLVVKQNYFLSFLLFQPKLLPRERDRFCINILKVRRMRSYRAEHPSYSRCKELAI